MDKWRRFFKNIRLLWKALPIVMMVLSGCSSEENLASCHCENLLVKTVENITGTMRYEDRLGRWYIAYPFPFATDAADHYFPDKLDKRFKQEGMMVVVSGDVYKMEIDWHEDVLVDIGGLSRYCIDILSIEEYFIEQ